MIIIQKPGEKELKIYVLMSLGALLGIGALGYASYILTPLDSLGDYILFPITPFCGLLALIQLILHTEAYQHKKMVHYPRVYFLIKNITIYYFGIVLGFAGIIFLVTSIGGDELNLITAIYVGSMMGGTFSFLFSIDRYEKYENSLVNFYVSGSILKVRSELESAITEQEERMRAAVNRYYSGYILHQNKTLHSLVSRIGDDKMYVINFILSQNGWVKTNELEIFSTSELYKFFNNKLTICMHNWS